MIRYVTKEDINKVRSMMEQVKEAFPGYQEAEFMETLDKAIDDKEALLEEKEGRLAGMLTFSYQEKELRFLAVMPEFRKQGVGKRLIKRMAECFEDGEAVHVITFREGVRKEWLPVTVIIRADFWMMKNWWHLIIHAKK